MHLAPYTSKIHSLPGCVANGPKYLTRDAVAHKIDNVFQRAKVLEGSHIWSSGMQKVEHSKLL